MTDHIPSANPLLAKLRVVDGFTVRLPSRGLLYGPQVLHGDVKDGEVRVYPMTTRDEILLRSADGLFGGNTIEQVFKRCVPQVLEPSLLFFNDLDYLMVALRQISYGEEMEIEYKHECADAKDHSYVVRVDTLMKNSKEIDPLTLDETFSVLLGTGQEVKLRPIRLVDMMRILQPPSNTELTAEQAEEEMLRLYMSQIESVEGETDEELIYEWIANLPTIYVKEIRAKIAEMAEWGVSYEQTIKCRDCGELVKISTPINPVTFFS